MTYRRRSHRGATLTFRDATPRIKMCHTQLPSQDFRFSCSDGTSLHPHPAKRNHFSTR